ncbi:hypothetical protein EYF80_052497 [Liparis tanakae]|uniref:Uncharacterized protein n=1 Tax=Liparis tanakae TaxID=230148 RepID=A0A4Z2F937_9TELE|nr:hypothetical protein EYF80_052497 [Liparis tanakae]
MTLEGSQAANRKRVNQDLRREGLLRMKGYIDLPEVRKNVTGVDGRASVFETALNTKYSDGIVRHRGPLLCFLILSFLPAFISAAAPFSFGRRGAAPLFAPRLVKKSGAEDTR